MILRSTFRTCYRPFWMALAGCLLATTAAHAQAATDAIARKAYAARHDRVYALGGWAMPDYSGLNTRLEATKRFPALGSGALMVGVGYGQGFGPVGIALEWRVSVRAQDIASTEAYTNLLTNTFGLVGRYNVLVGSAYTVSVVAGPTYSRLNLTLKEPRAPNTTPTTFDSQLIAGGDKRKLYQSQFGVAVGVQLERHFAWGRRNDIQACGRARQITVGARVMYDHRVKSYRWHTERPLFRPDTRLEAKPEINPVGFSAALMVSGLFSRY